MIHTRSVRKGLLAALVLACATLLSACSLWSKVTGAPAAESTAPLAPPPPAMAAPAACTDCTEGAQPAAVAVAQSPAAPVALSPMPPTAPVAEPAGKAPMAATLPASPAAKSMATSALVPGFYVNAGLYAVPGNANRAYSKLESAGLPVFTEVIATKDGQRTRIRVGPYPTRAKADAAAKKIRALKLDAVVFKH